MKGRHAALLAILALFAGLALGWALKETPAPSEGASGKRQTSHKAPIADAGDKASVAALRARIAELERLLAERPRENAPFAQSTNAPEARRLRGPERFREEMARLERENPARYAEITNRMARFRARRQARAASRMAFLASVDTANMSASAKKTHAALQEALTRREEIEERLHQEGLSDSERDQLMRELHELSRESRTLYTDERKNLLNETAGALGLGGDDAAALVTTVDEILDATTDARQSMPPPDGGGPGGPRGPGGPGGQPPR